MILPNEALLAEFRKGNCEWCSRTPVEPSHLVPRGMGGGKRIDGRLNLNRLCRFCHDAHHAGDRPLEADLRALIAARERCLQPDIEAVMQMLRRLPKSPWPSDLARGLAELNTAAQELARRTLDEANINVEAA